MQSVSASDTRNGIKKSSSTCWGKRSPSNAAVIAGDCHYVKRHMPHNMKGKIIVTNTTTPEDVEFFRQRGVRYLITTTPCLEGRSFGTNMMEAALVAVSGKKRRLSTTELKAMIGELNFTPQIRQLNP